MAFELKNALKGKSTLPPRIGLYGPNGIGKTSFGASAPNPFFVPTEDGIGESLDYDRAPVCTHIDEVLNWLQSLAKEKHDYKTVVIDTYNGIERLSHNEVAKEAEVKTVGDIGFQEGFTRALYYMEKMFSALDWLREKRNMITIVLCQSAVKTFNPPNLEPYSRYSPDLHPKSSRLFTDWPEYLLFANHDVITKTSGEGFTKREKGVSQGTRTLYTVDEASHVAKHRGKLPDRIKFPEENAFAHFCSKIGKTK